MKNNPIYQIADLKQKYADRTVLDLDNLEIAPGEILGLVGPSGAGKSTLLRLLNFLESPTTGRIVYQNQPLNGSVPMSVRRQVTTVFQRPVLFRASVRAKCGSKIFLFRSIRVTIYVSPIFSPRI